MTKYYLVALSLFILVGMGCGGNDGSPKKMSEKEKLKQSLKYNPLKDKGVGPVTSLELPESIDQEMAKTGEDLYVLKCSACHKATEKYIGPAPKGIFERRSPEWIMNMILNPEKMIVENEAAKKLLMEYNGSPMANQNLTEEEARSILEYFRTL